MLIGVLVFSKNKNFPVYKELEDNALYRRHTASNPLYHLYKDLNENAVGLWSVVKDNATDLPPKIFQNYNAEEIKIVIKKEDDGTASIIIYGNPDQNYRKKINIGSFLFFKIFAWADNKNPFKIGCKIKRS